LSTIKIRIPDIAIEADGFNVSLTSLACSHFQLGDTNSTFVPPDTLASSVSGIGALCHGNWNLSETSFPFFHASGNISITFNDSSVYSAVTTEQDQDGFSTNATLSECSIVIKNLDIDFGAGFVDNLLALFEKMIAAEVEDNASIIVCKILSRLVVATFGHI
jgi:hypothetical protein